MRSLEPQSRCRSSGPCEALKQSALVRDDLSFEEKAERLARERVAAGKGTG